MAISFLHEEDGCGRSLSIAFWRSSACQPRSTPRASLHRMQTDDVAFGVIDERDEAVLTDRELVLHDPAARGRNAVRFDGAIVAGKVHDDAVAVGRTAFHLD